MKEKRIFTSRLKYIKVKEFILCGFDVIELCDYFHIYNNKRTNFISFSNKILHFDKEFNNCDVCDKKLPSTCFDIDKKTNILKTICKLCLFKQQVITQNYKLRTKAQLLKEKAIQYKGGKCELCDCKTQILSSYDFHHLNPSEKDFNISTALAQTNDLEKIKPELDKCILLCGNCHRFIHSIEYENLLVGAMNQSIKITPSKKQFKKLLSKSLQ